TAVGYGPQSPRGRRGGPARARSPRRCRRSRRAPGKFCRPSTCPGPPCVGPPRDIFRHHPPSSHDDGVSSANTFITPATKLFNTNPKRQRGPPSLTLRVSEDLSYRSNTPHTVSAQGSGETSKGTDLVERVGRLAPALTRLG